MRITPVSSSLDAEVAVLSAVPEALSAGLTSRQRQLARHALGFGPGRKKSYRNRYIVPSGPDYEEWSALVNAGLARHDPGIDLFWLTAEGASMALNPGETLDREDFPTRASDLPRTIVHGVDCVKMPHGDVQFAHEEHDDRAARLMDITICGRCHQAL